MGDDRPDDGRLEDGRLEDGRLEDGRAGAGPDDAATLATYWQHALERVARQVGDGAAAAAMLAQAINALRARMGPERTADLLETLAPAVRAGQDVAIGPGSRSGY